MCGFWDQRAREDAFCFVDNRLGTRPLRLLLGNDIYALGSNSRG